MRYEVLGKISRPQGQAVCAINAAVPSGADYKFEGPVCGSIKLVNTGEGISAQGRLRATVVLDCGRCLCVHKAALDIEVDEICSLDQVDEPQPGEVDSEGRCPVPIRDTDVVDLGELVRQLLILSVPPRSLCRPDCRGLCPQCGQNLNEGQCQCDQQQVDPRLAPLQKLLP